MRQPSVSAAVERISGSGFELLDGFADEAAGILEAGDLSRRRLAYLRTGIEKRIDTLRVIWG